ncbi:hypothetical protein V6N11_053357 [Hibiscus sabdariffa]|uniref:Transcription repressor n=1 Tax=Hibiscus sabdariffa TaxID=183260 RepID=A0ABR2UCU5_9ROSI
MGADNVDNKKEKNKVKDSFAVVKRSSDPYNDFRTSMVEMIVESQMFATHPFTGAGFHKHHPKRDGDEEEQDDDEIEETPGEFRKRVATELLDKMRAIARKEKEDRDGDEEEARDSLVTKILQ